MLNTASHDPVAFGQSSLAQVATLDHSRLVQRRFSVAGQTLDAWFSDAAYANLCEHHLAQLPISKAVTAGITLYLLETESIALTIPRWPGDVLDRQQANRAWAEAGLRGAYLHDPRVWQFYDPARRLGVQWIRRPGATPPWESGAPLRIFLHWALSRSNRRLCHGATLGRNGKGLLLVGAGGSGKSGTTLAGIAAGFDTVGDDYCLLENTERLTAYPLFRILKQDVGGVQRAFGQEALARYGALNWQNKFEIHESALPRSPFVEDMEMVAILLPKVAMAERSSWRRISPGEAMRALAPSSAFQLPDGETEAIAFAASVCRKLPCYEMQLSTSAAEIAEQLSALLASLCP